MIVQIPKRETLSTLSKECFYNTEVLISNVSLSDFQDGKVKSEFLYDTKLEQRFLPFLLHLFFFSLPLLYRPVEHHTYTTKYRDSRTGILSLFYQSLIIIYVTQNTHHF